MNIDDQCSNPKGYTVPEYRIIECQLGRYEVQVEASVTYFVTIIRLPSTPLFNSQTTNKKNNRQ